MILKEDFEFLSLAFIFFFFFSSNLGILGILNKSISKWILRKPV